MPRKLKNKRCWYEAQRLVNAYEDNSGGEWIEWEVFPYDHERWNNGTLRLKARREAVASAKDCIKKTGNLVRAVHIEQIFIDGVDDAQDC